MYVNNNPLRYTDPTGHCIFGVDTVVCIAIGVALLKAIDYGWTTYDTIQSAKVLNNPEASSVDKMFAALNIALAVIFEIVEPDDASPVSLPVDDIARATIMKGAKEAFEEGGEEALKKYLKEVLGDKADEVIEKLCPGGSCTVPGMCFEAGTLVSTPEGKEPIENIQVGDQVYALDPITGDLGVFIVTDVFARAVDRIVEIKIGDDVIHSTEEHPFWVEGLGWTAAAKLRAGDCVTSQLGVCQPVISSRVLEKTTIVYNFTVDLAHTYFIGRGSWLVHNQCFPTADEWARRLGVTKTVWHDQIKKSILKDKEIAAIMRKNGITNPDIGIDKAGNILLKAKDGSGKVISTGIPLEPFIRDFTE